MMIWDAIKTCLFPGVHVWPQSRRNKWRDRFAPRYRISERIFAWDAVVEPFAWVDVGGRCAMKPVVILWWQKPSHAMIPENLIARIVMAIWRPLPVARVSWMGNPKPPRRRLTKEQLRLVYDHPSSERHVPFGERRR